MGLERHPDLYPFCQFLEKCPHFSLFLIRHWINENKTGKDNVCKGKSTILPGQEKYSFRANFAHISY